MRARSHERRLTARILVQANLKASSRAIPGLILPGPAAAVLLAATTHQHWREGEPARKHEIRRWDRPVASNSSLW